MKTLLQKLFAIIQTQTGLDAPPFNEGCSVSQIEQAEKTLNVKLPKDYRAFLRYSDGQSDFYTLKFPPDQIVFLPVEGVVDLWKELNQYPDDQFFDEVDSGKKNS